VSRKNTQHEKKIRQLRRALKKGRLPEYINLLDWLKDHKHADSRGKAFKIISERRVMSESHVVGLAEIEGHDGSKGTVVNQFVPARLRPTLRVVDEDETA
jgi:hypothetical protein